MPQLLKLPAKIPGYETTYALIQNHPGVQLKRWLEYRDLKTSGNRSDLIKRIPNYSRLHPVIPRLYVQEWKTDMKNRKLILKNAELGGNPHYEHDENLFLDKREQMKYNVEDRNRVNSKCKMPARAELLHPPFHHEASKYQSELMMRQESDIEGV